MFEIILNPPGLTEPQYVEFYKTLLSVSGVLFGLAFGGMLFILQSGFTTFTFSRKMFLKVYLHFGRQILFALAFRPFHPILRADVLVLFEIQN